MERDSRGALKISKDGVEICTLSWYIGYKGESILDNSITKNTKNIIRQE